METLQDQIKHLAEDYSRYDALRTEALEKLQRLIAASNNANGDVAPADAHKRATIKRVNGESHKTPVIGRPPKIDSKAYAVLAMLINGPATIAEIMTYSQWNENTVRGFLSTAAKRFQVVIGSMKREDGKRVYFIR
jgi:hypothetical protein